MKKVLTLAAGLALTASVASAQSLSIGAVGAIGHSFVGNVPSPLARDFKLSGALGVGLVYSSNEHWGLGTSLSVSHEGFGHEDNIIGGTKYDQIVNPVYLRLPVNAIYFFGKYGDHVRPKIYAGPSVAVKVDEAYDYSINNNGNGDSKLQTGGNLFRRWDWGVNAGAGVNIKMCKNTWLNLDGNYYLGLQDATNTNDQNINDGYNNNQHLRLNVGIMWGI